MSINGTIVIKPEFFKTDYSNAVESESIKPHLETIYKRWNDLGFTDGLDGELKRKCSYAFEQLAQYLIYEKASEGEKEYYEETNFETIGFPIIRRVLTVIDKDGIDFEFDKFINYYNLFDVNKLLDMLRGTGFNGAIDEEAEAVATVSMMIVDMFKNPEANPESIKETEYERIRKHLKKD